MQTTTKKSLLIFHSACLLTFNFGDSGSKKILNSSVSRET